MPVNNEPAGWLALLLGLPLGLPALVVLALAWIYNPPWPGSAYKGPPMKKPDGDDAAET